MAVGSPVSAPEGGAFVMAPADLKTAVCWQQKAPCLPFQARLQPQQAQQAESPRLAAPCMKRQFSSCCSPRIHSFCMHHTSDHMPQSHELAWGERPKCSNARSHNDHAGYGSPLQLNAGIAVKSQPSATSSRSWCIKGGPQFAQRSLAFQS